MEDDEDFGRINLLDRCDDLMWNSDFALRLSLSEVCCSDSSLDSMADEEPVDPKHYLEETCKPKCVKPLRAYQACVKRIQGDESGHKHCTGQYFDYWSCVDKCVALRLFSKLK
ncbi:hypothetical protein Droror1_Dr00020420 [Drosera rotundifolia]